MAARAEKGLDRASMGPQLISCGTRIACAIWICCSGFNGAAADQLRNVPISVRQPDDCLKASMGPQLISCGTRVKMKDWRAAARASMGPQLISCGTARAALDGNARECASMGPQLISCGTDEPQPGGGRGVAALQWGRS